MTAPIAKRPPILSKLVTDQWTKPFWDAAAQHRLVAARCGNCGRFRMPPTPFCPHCRSQSIDWVELSGQGAVYSYSVVTRALVPGTDDSIPYITAVIALPDADDIRLISNVIDAPIDQIGVGDIVSVIWDDRSEGVTIPLFRLI